MLFFLFSFRVLFVHFSNIQQYTTRQFTQSQHEYLLSDCDPRVVLSLFQPLLPEGVDFSNFANGGGGGGGGGGGARVVKDVIDKSAITNLLIPFLIHARSHPTATTATTATTTTTSSGDGGLLRPHPSQTRVPRSNTMPVQLDEVIDTVLLKAYIFTNAPLVDVVDFLTGGGREEGTTVAASRWAQCRALVDESEGKKPTPRVPYY